MERFQTENRLDDESISRPDADMVSTEEPKEETKQPSAAGWRLLAILAAVLAVGGLFLGLLGKVLSFMQPIGFFMERGDTLSGSLIGYAIDYLKYFFGNASTIFSLGADVALSSIADILLVFGLFVAAAFSVVAFIVSLASKKYAGKMARASVALVFLAYGGLFLWSYLCMSARATWDGITAPTREICDIPTAIVATVALFLLCVGAIASNRRCVANVFLLISSLLVAFLTCYPGTLTASVASVGVLSFGSYAFVKAAMLIFMIVIAFNIFVSVVRIYSAKRYAFDCFRYALLLFGALLTVIAFIATPITESRWAIFQGVQLFCTIGFIFLCIAALVCAVVALLFRRRSAEANADANENGETEFPEAALFAEAERPAGAETAAAEQPAESREAVQMTLEAPISEFERRMEALARGEQPDLPQTAQTVLQAQTQPQSFISSSMRGGAARPAGYADANQYTYDPFINSLSPQEKNEFGDLFIACKAGKFEGLPTYVIGGNNDEFFRKVFIYLGKFRKEISAELLDKLYTFVSKIG